MNPMPEDVVFFILIQWKFLVRQILVSVGLLTAEINSLSHILLSSCDILESGTE